MSHLLASSLQTSVVQLLASLHVWAGPLQTPSLQVSPPAPVQKSPSSQDEPFGL
jgi:hypothetical protein